MKKDKSIENTVKEKFGSKIKFFKPNEKFNFKCTACGICCFGKDIVLEPIDIIRMRNALGKNTNEIFNAGFMDIHIGGNSGLPICCIKMLYPAPKVKKCPFLAPAIKIGNVDDFMKEMKSIKAIVNKLGGPSKENMEKAMQEVLKKRKITNFVCAINANKPIICRLWPCGRCHEFDKKNSKYKGTKWFMTEKCEGHDVPNSLTTLEQWKKDQGIDRYDNVTKKWNELLQKLLKIGLTAWKKKDKKDCIYKEEVSDDVIQILAGILYNFDAIPTFKQDLRVQKTITDKNATFEDFEYVFDKILDNVSLLTDVYEARGGKDKQAMKRCIKRFHDYANEQIKYAQEQIERLEHLRKESKNA